MPGLRAFLPDRPIGAKYPFAAADARRAEEKYQRAYSGMDRKITET